MGDTHLPRGGGSDALKQSRQGFGREIKCIFHASSALQVLSIPEEESWLQSERSFIQAVKNNHLYLYRGLVSKRNYASITGHFRP